ncbi:hypothetical protein ACTXT7_004147 [Hymenolepis weldensis]
MFANAQMSMLTIVSTTLLKYGHTYTNYANEKRLRTWKVNHTKPRQKERPHETKIPKQIA